MPLRTATEFVDKLIRARVAARRIVTILARRARPRDDRDAAPPSTGTSSTSPPPLVDPVTGVVIEPGRRHRAGQRPPGGDLRARPPPGAHPARPRTACAGATSRSTTCPVDAVRARVVVSEADPHLFSGPVARGARRRRATTTRHAAVCGRQRLRRPRGARARDGRRARGARPRPVRRPAPARRPGPRAAARPRGARAHRADERGRRPHRGPDRRAARGRTGPGAPRCSSPRARCCSTAPTPSCSSRAAGSSRPARHHDLLRSHPAYRDVVLRGEELMSPLLGRTDHAARTLPIATSADGARAHQGAAARPPRAARVGARLARRRRPRRPRRPVGHRPGRAGGHHRRRQPGAASTSSSRCSSRRSSSRPCSPGWPAGPRSCCPSGSSPGCARTSSPRRCACRCRSSSAPAPATSSRARPTTSSRSRTSSGSASRRSSSR